MKYIQQKNYILMWLVIPAAFVLLYPYVRDIPQYLEWLTTGIVVAVLFFSVVVHELIALLFYSLITPKKISGKGVRGKMLLADKTTGEVKASYEEDTWLSVDCAAEDASAIYLLARVSESKAVNSELMIVNKNTLELKRIPVGKNIFLPKNNFKIFPQQQLVFIPKYMNIGGYALPLLQN